MQNNWTRSATALGLLSLCACAGPPVRVVCQVPEPPAPLMEAPAAETFRSRLDAILQQSFTSSPTTPTAKP